MIKESSNIKLLIKYYDYSKDNNYYGNISNNELNPTASNSNTALNQNHRFSINSILSNNNKTPSGKNINNKEKNHINDTYNQKELFPDYLVFFQNKHNYNNLENSFPPKIINIKTCIYLYLMEKKNIDITLDSLVLFKYYKNQYHILNDGDNFYPNNNSKAKKKELNDKNISNSTILYYYICNDKIKVIIDLYSQSIDSISINVSKMCSLLMLKYLILLKLREIEKTNDISNFDKISNEAYNNSKSSKISLITIEDIEKKEKLYGNGIIKNDLTNYIVKNQTNRNFNNDSTISQIYNYYINGSDKMIDLEKDINCIKYDDNSSSSEGGILNFILMEKKDNKCRLGLDFRFTILQNFHPLSKEENIEEEKMEVINYYQNDYYQIKSGINLYFNCLNSNCKNNKDIFILNIGYGTFDILNLIRHNSLCPFCIKKTNTNNRIKYYEKNNIKNVDLKYIGMMNSKWSYKGYLEGIKMTTIEGKGLTVINDLLYRTKEFNFLSQFKKLLFQIEFYVSKNDYIKSIDSSIISDNMNIDNENIRNNKAKIEEKNKEKIIKENNEHIKKQEKKMKDIEITKYNKNNQKNNEKFIKFTKENKKNQLEEIDFENNIFQTLKHKNSLYKKSNSIKPAFQVNNNKRYSQNIENFDNNNTNIDFNIIIDKAKTNCCENCFEYDQISRVCSIF